MKKFNKVLLTIASASLAAGSALTYAGTVTTTATVTVQNAIAIVENAPLSFGTVAVSTKTDTGAESTPANLVIASDGTAPTATNGNHGTPANSSKMTKITDGSPAEYAITGAPAFTSITVTLPADTAGVELTNAAAPNGNGTFDVKGFSVYDVTSTNSPTDTDDGVFAVTTDLSGNVVFRVGATVSVVDDNTATFIDGAYTGTYDVTVAY